MILTLKKVFSQIRYVTITVVTSVIVFAFAVWLPNLRLVTNITFSSSISIIEKISFLFSLFGSIQTNFSTISAIYTLIITALFGINVALLIYYIRSRQASKLGSGATFSVGGLISGVFGIGCATCGTFLLSSLLSTFGGIGVLTFLPFGGEEFGFLGVGLLLYSLYILLKKMDEPVVCVV